jgi:hypothetical protein
VIQEVRITLECKSCASNARTPRNSNNGNDPQHNVDNSYIFVILLWKDIKKRNPESEQNKGNNPQQSVADASQHKKILQNGSEANPRRGQGRGLDRVKRSQVV